MSLSKIESFDANFGYITDEERSQALSAIDFIKTVSNTLSITNSFYKEDHAKTNPKANYALNQVLISGLPYQNRSSLRGTQADFLKLVFVKIIELLDANDHLPDKGLKPNGVINFANDKIENAKFVTPPIQKLIQIHTNHAEIVSLITERIYVLLAPLLEKHIKYSSVLDDSSLSCSAFYEKLDALKTGDSDINPVNNDSDDTSEIAKELYSKLSKQYIMAQKYISILEVFYYAIFEELGGRIQSYNTFGDAALSYVEELRNQPSGTSYTNEQMIHLQELLAEAKEKTAIHDEVCHKDLPQWKILNLYHEQHYRFLLLLMNIELETVKIYNPRANTKSDVHILYHPFLPVNGYVMTPLEHRIHGNLKVPVKFVRQAYVDALNLNWPESLAGILSNYAVCLSHYDGSDECKNQCHQIESQIDEQIINLSDWHFTLPDSPDEARGPSPIDSF